MYENIEKLMKSKNLNPNELAIALGISSQLLYNWKNGKAKPSLPNLEKLSEFFDVPITYFFTGEIIEKQQSNFSNEDLLLARELNKSDKIKLIKDLLKIRQKGDLELITALTKKFLDTQK